MNGMDQKNKVDNEKKDQKYVENEQLDKKEDVKD